MEPRQKLALDSQISQMPTATGDGLFLVSGLVNRDAWELAKTGKKQVLERRFGLASMIGFSCSIMITWESAIFFFTFGLSNGGPAGLIWGFLICWMGTASVFLSMGELASMLPTAGGQYYWVNILASQTWGRFLSYITGWITIIAWVAALTTDAYGTGQIVQYLVKLNHPTYVSQPWHALFIMYGVLLIALILNIWLGKILPVVEIVILVIHIVGFFVTLVPLCIIGDFSDKGKVFTTFYNAGGWSSQTLSFFIGLYGNATAFLGTDGAIHMSEEISNSSVNTPRSMILSIMINGVLGFVVLIIFLLVGGNLQEVVESGSLFPFIPMLQFALGSNSGVTAIGSMILSMSFFCAVALLSSASRMVWSFAREQALPGWTWLRKVDRHTSVPNNAAYLVVFVAALLGLINLGSSTTFAALTSLILEGFYSSYLIVLLLLLYRRLCGDIGEERVHPVSPDTLKITRSNGSRIELVWGPWRIKGIFGTLNNIFAICYLLVLMIFSFWPPAVDPTPQSMNWSIVVLGGVAITSVFYYFLTARKQYSGPRMEVVITKL